MRFAVKHAPRGCTTFWVRARPAPGPATPPAPVKYMSIAGRRPTPVGLAEPADQLGGWEQAGIDGVNVTNGHLPDSYLEFNKRIPSTLQRVGHDRLFAGQPVPQDLRTHGWPVPSPGAV